MEDGKENGYSCLLLFDALMIFEWISRGLGRWKFKLKSNPRQRNGYWSACHQLFLRLPVLD